MVLSVSIYAAVEIELRLAFGYVLSSLESASFLIRMSDESDSICY